MRRRTSEAGFTLIALMALVTIMLLTMGVGVPFWRHLVKDDREQELIFRGGQIADAIQRYQGRNANAPPPTLEVLVEQRYLRRLYTDPMTPEGAWRLVRQGESIGPIRAPGGSSPAAGGSPFGASATPTPAPSGPAAGNVGPVTGTTLGGGIVGVASTSQEQSLRLFNGRDRYDEWLFIAGQPRVVGAQPTGPMPGAAVPAPGPGAAPTPLSGPTPLSTSPTPLR